MTEEDRAKGIEALLQSEPAAARVTADLMADMLMGYELRPAKSLDWLADKIRPIVWVAARQQMPPGNAELRDHLLSLAGRLRELFADCCSLSHASDEFHKLAQDLERNKAGFWERRLLDAYYDHEHLVHLAQFYETAAARLDEAKQSPKWRSKHKRDWRIRIALLLMPIFEETFSRKATLNRWPSQRGENWLGHWADFYQRVLASTLGEVATPDLEGVLADARQQLRTSGYSPGDFIGE